uniref:Uncharacterized protein n=1 Tax=Anopheles minimus TaxID=112268 RepID=A0A182WNM4_9DIPT
MVHFWGVRWNLSYIARSSEATEQGYTHTHTHPSSGLFRMDTTDVETVRSRYIVCVSFHLAVVTSVPLWASQEHAVGVLKPSCKGSSSR